MNEKFITLNEENWFFFFFFFTVSENNNLLTNVFSPFPREESSCVR